MTVAASFLIRESAEVYQIKASEHLTSHQLADFRRCPLLYCKKKLGLIEDEDRRGLVVCFRARRAMPSTRSWTCVTASTRSGTPRRMPRGPCVWTTASASSPGSPNGSASSTPATPAGRPNNGEHNWQKGIPASVMLNHAIRHIYL
jgi:hypothetical protein